MTRKNITLIIVIAGIIGSIAYLQLSKPKRVHADAQQIITETKSEKASKYPLAKELTDVQGFINAKPFSIQDEIGKKVILIDFWTYSCINCQHTTPYLNAWWKQYEDDGLLIIGVHTPEFEFEKKYDNVVEATKRFGIKYPVVQDNNYGTWSAYNNSYWPRKYLIDIDGYIAYDHIGEGGYDETEQKIRELLTERKQRLGESGEINKNMASLETTQTTNTRPGSPETYFGAMRNEYLTNGIRGKIGIQNLKTPTTLQTNALYLTGSWNITKEYAENIDANSKTIFQFNATKVNLVAESEKATKIYITLDGKDMGSAEISKSQLYNIVSLSAQGTHTLELRAASPNVHFYTYTFE
jgi:thiol-disulfide isomerase/thioredoxin